MQSHGELVLEWQDDLLIVKPIGPFNEEGAIEIIEVLKSSIISKNFTSWSRLEIWDAETLGSPLVTARVKDFFIWCIEQGCRSTAVVVKNSIQRELVERYFLGKIPVFSNENDAIEWLSVNKNNK